MTAAKWQPCPTTRFEKGCLVSVKTRRLRQITRRIRLLRPNLMPNRRRRLRKRFRLRGSARMRSVHGKARPSFLAARGSSAAPPTAGNANGLTRTTRRSRSHDETTESACHGNRCEGQSCTLARVALQSVRKYFCDASILIYEHGRKSPAMLSLLWPDIRLCHRVRIKKGKRGALDG